MASCTSPVATGTRMAFAVMLSRRLISWLTADESVRTVCCFAATRTRPTVTPSAGASTCTLEVGLDARLRASVVANPT